MDIYTGVGLSDPWKYLRQKAYRNIEPEVKLIAMTQVTDELKKQGITPGTLPAYTARHCWESTKKYGNDPVQNCALDKQLVQGLIKRGHDTPLQAVEYVFDVSGISKTLHTQWVRHKVGTGWSFRSTRYVNATGNEFVYNTYDYIKDEDTVKKLLALDEDVNKHCVEIFDKKMELDSTKQDGRKVMPVSFACHCSFFANARAMRHFFKLRLTMHAEWEIRRLAVMLLEECMKVTPEIFSDIYEKYTQEPDEESH